MRTAVSCHLFLYHDLIRDGVFEAVAEAGFRRVELWAMQDHMPYQDDEKLDKIVEIMAKNGVAAASAHLPMYERIYFHKEDRLMLSPSDPDEKQRKMWIEHAGMSAAAAARLGARVMTVHTDMIFDRDEPGREEALRRSMDEMIESKLPGGCVLALENTPGGPRQVDGIMKFVGDYPPDLMGVTLDVGHAHIDTDLLDAVGMIGTRMASVHAHDNDGRGDSHLMPGDGNVPWDDLIKALDRIGFDGPLAWEIRDTTAGNDPGLAHKKRILEELRKFDERLSGS